MALPEDLSKFDTLVAIIARLRAPDGCPWDKEQTHQTLRGNLLSESYEVLEALDKGDAAELCEELGDLLLQIVLHAQIAKDEGEFQIGDVVQGITTKIIRRHPHIFGTKKVKDAEEVMHNWEALKKEEREEGKSMLAGVPKEMPALAYAYEISRRAVRVGFEWENLEGVIDKLAEEVREIKESQSQAGKSTGNRRPALYPGQFRPVGRCGPGNGAAGSQPASFTVVFLRWKSSAGRAVKN